jgi:hypothetical protein
MTRKAESRIPNSVTPELLHSWNLLFLSRIERITQTIS